MDDVKNLPIVFEDLHGREFVVFDEDHSHSDILRYVVLDIGYDDAHMILDIMEKEEAEFKDEEKVVDEAR